MTSVGTLRATASPFDPPGSWCEVDGRFDALWPSASTIEGWLAGSQARALFRAATVVPAGRWIIEIGSHRGRSTVFLASAKQDGVPMLAVDPFDNLRWGGGPESLARFEATLGRFGLSSSVELFRGISSQASAQWESGPIGLLFVDGAHDRRSVLDDIAGWERHVASGGLVFFHDAFSSIGVTQVLTECHLWSRRFRYVGSTRTLVAFERVDASFWTAVASSARVSTRYPYFVRNGLIKLAIRRGWKRLPALLWYREGDDLF